MHNGWIVFGVIAVEHHRVAHLVAWCATECENKVGTNPYSLQCCFSGMICDKYDSQFFLVSITTFAMCFLSLLFSLLSFVFQILFWHQMVMEFSRDSGAYLFAFICG